MGFLKRAEREREEPRLRWLLFFPLGARSGKEMGRGRGRERERADRRRSRKYRPAVRGGTCVPSRFFSWGRRFIISGRADQNWILKSWQMIEVFRPTGQLVTSGEGVPMDGWKQEWFGMITHVFVRS